MNEKELKQPNEVFKISDFNNTMNISVSIVMIVYGFIAVKYHLVGLGGIFLCMSIYQTNSSLVSLYDDYAEFKPLMIGGSIIFVKNSEIISVALKGKNLLFSLNEKGEVSDKKIRLSLLSPEDRVEVFQYFENLNKNGNKLEIQ